MDKSYKINNKMLKNRIMSNKFVIIRLLIRLNPTIVLDKVILVDKVIVTKVVVLKEVILFLEAIT